VLAGRGPIKTGWFMADWAQIIVKDQDPQYFFAYILFIINCMNDNQYQSVVYELQNSQKEPEKNEKDLERIDLSEDPKYLSAKVTIKDGDFPSDLHLTVQLLENSDKSQLALQFFIEDGISDIWDLRVFVNYFKSRMRFKFTDI
jgi:hypothetical protein